MNHKITSNFPIIPSSQMFLLKLLRLPFDTYAHIDSHLMLTSQLVSFTYPKSTFKNLCFLCNCEQTYPGREVKHEGNIGVFWTPTSQGHTKVQQLHLVQLLLKEIQKPTEHLLHIEKIPKSELLGKTGTHTCFWSPPQAQCHTVRRELPTPSISLKSEAFGPHT